MFDDAVKQLEEKGKGGRKYFKSHLNTKTLMQANGMFPTVLIINCHGEQNKKNETYFCFEHENSPSLVHNTYEKDLIILLDKDKQGNRFVNVQLAIISACHSGELA